jgi:hypothetical protein
MLGGLIVLRKVIRNVPAPGARSSRKTDWKSSTRTVRLPNMTACHKTIRARWGKYLIDEQDRSRRRARQAFDRLVFPDASII